MGNAENGQLLWKSNQHLNYYNNKNEISAEIPSELLNLKYVSRDINFSSIEEIKNLRLV